MIRKVALLLSCLNQIVFCQNTKINFDNFTTEDGLSDNYVNCVLQDHKGWIWIGTGMGIERFDGIKFKKYAIYSSDAKVKEVILARNFYESHTGTLYACAEDVGLFKYNQGKDCFERLLINGNPVLTDVSVKDLVEDMDGSLWAATKKGICKIDLKNQKVISYVHDGHNENSLINDYVRRLVLDDSSKLWIGTQHGLDKFDPANKSFVHYSKINPLLNDDILDICLDNKKRIWIGTSSHGIVIINNPQKGNSLNFIPDRKNDRSYKVNAILQDREKKFWIGTRGGLYLYDEKDNSIILLENNLLENKSLIHNSVMKIAQDKKGDLWISTRGGLSYMVKEKQEFEYYRALPNNNKYLNNSEIYCIWIDKSGNVWMGTENGGVNILDRKKGTFKYLTASANGLSNNCIKSINSVGDGKLLIATFQGGLNVYNERTGKITWLKHDPKNKNSISSDMVWDICLDKTGAVWIGTTSGLDKYDPVTQKFVHFPEFDNMVNGVTWIGVDSDNDLWLGSEIIKVFRPGHGIINTFKEKGRGFFVDSKGQYWVMSGNRGIVLYDKNKGALKVYDENAGIASKLTYCMLEDRNNNLWISTADGLSCFNPKNKTFKNYYNIDGLQGNQFHYGAACKANNGEMLFGGVKGLNIFNPDKIIENKYIPPVYITDFKIFNQSVQISNDKRSILKESITETERLEVPYKFNVLTFEFAALNYTNSIRNKYKYKLEGFDNGWTESTENRSATYTNLNPGEYCFRVIASNDKGYWNETGTSKKLVILPPFYRTFWFIAFIFCVVTILFSLVFIFIFKRRELRKTFEFEKIKAQKLHELDLFKLQFFTNISHEIKTPLTLIISPLKKILKYDFANSEVKENLNLMERNADHLMKLVTQLLDYRKLQEGKLKIEMKRGDIVQFCKEVFLSFEGVMKEQSIKYKFGSVQQKIVTGFDPDKLKNILNNLIFNAIRYNKKGGSIIFFISLDIEQEKEFNQAEKHYIKIVLKDSGIGINENEIPKIFDRYYSKSSEKGFTSSGIGLAFTKELIALHHGKIQVESKEGFGTTFTMMLPFIEDLIENAQEFQINEISSKEYIKTETFELEQKNKKILLVVEDNEDVRSFIKSHFKKEYLVLEATDGKEGLELAIKTIPDIMISDIMMPEMDGKELCEKIKKDERTSHIPIILLTALSSKDHMKEGLVKGADDYITKPFDIDLLQIKVENLLKVRKSLREKYSKQMVLQPTNIAIKTLDEKFLQKAIKIIEENMDDSDLDIEKFVSQIGVSRMQLYRKIAALTNMTVKEFVNDIRLKRAAQIFSEQIINISEVAYSVGFNDLSYFGKCFKRKYGMSASEYYQKAHKKSIEP